ncbi:MAG: glycoside hydrolase family 57 protein, partial [Candidatus Omnitrophota bacterium]
YRKKNTELEGIYRKERGFSEEEKMRVLSLQQDAIKEIIPLYKRLYDTGQIELITTPYYHPILPILNSGVSSYGYSWEEDVSWHIEKALELFTNTFGRKPKGIWPAEGSVSRSILYPFVKRGIEWLATDEEILLASLGGGNRNELIYKPYSIKSGDGYINMVFRDKKLSDLIGFSYANSRPEQAAEDFLENLRSIQRNVSGLGGEHLVSIILDGENAWEYYRDGGERFLSLLYEKICADPSLETVTIGDFIQRFPPSDELHNLYAGSWINHNFDIWYGHHEDRVGWEYVDRTRTFLKSVPLEEEKSKQAWEEIYAAEGSDWFWWFGDEFSSLSESTFDFLFRNHLMNVYRIAERAIPDYLQEPIKRKVKAAIKKEPIAFINPVIDGCVSTYYEWTHAGVYALDDALGAMQTAEKSIDTIYYGFNLTTLFFRLDINRNTPRERLKKCKGCLELITASHTYHLMFTFSKDAVLELYDVTDGKTTAINVFDGALSFDKIIEISCAFSSLCVQPNESIQFSFLLIENDIPVEKWPKFTTINFAVPDVDFEEMIWSA